MLYFDLRALPTCRTFPLEKNSRQVGALTLRAWIVSPVELQRALLDDDPVLSGGLSKEHSASNVALDINTECNVTGNIDLQNMGTNASHDDDNLFFELSASSESSSGVSTSLTMQSSGEANTAFGPLDGVDSKGTFDVQKPHVSECQRGRSGTLSAPERPGTPGDYCGAANAEIEQHAVTERESNRRHTYTENAAAGIYEHLSRGSPSERAGVSSSPVRDPHHEVGDYHQDSVVNMPHPYAEQNRNKKLVSPTTQAGLLQPGQMHLHEATPKPEAVDSTDEGVESESQPLDLSLAMLSLIPSFPPGSAEVRVRVHGILIPCEGNPPASPPYVRASIHPGASSIARTGIPVIYPTSTTTPRAGNTGSGGVLLEVHSRAERVVEYLFGREPGGANAANKGVVSLPLDPDVVSMMPERSGGTSPPTMRLEIVSSRSLGWCELALPEALRRPGGAFQKLQLPVWKKERPKKNGTRRTVQGCLSGIQEIAAAGEQGFDEGGITVGQINLDFGVVLSDDPEGPLSEMASDVLELTTGIVAVEAIDIRVRDGGSGMVQPTEFIGISVALTAGGGKPKLAPFGSRGCGRTGPEGSKPKRASVHEGFSHQGSEVLLKSTCAELDVLTMKLVHREEFHRSSNSGLGLEWRGGEQWKREGWKGRGGGGGENVVKIAVSDINDIFDGRSRWVEMYYDCCEGGYDSRTLSYLGNNAASGIKNVGSRRWMEVRLRLSLTDTVPVRQCEHQRTNTKEGGPSAADVVFPLKASSLIDPITEQDLMSVGGVPRPALEAWNISPMNGCSEAHVTFSSLGDRKQRRPFLHSRGKSERFPSQVGPGVVELEVLTIHGRGPEPRPATAISKAGNVNGNRQASISYTSSRLWVRVTYCNEREGGEGGRGRGGSGGPEEGQGSGGGGGRSGMSVMDSPPGGIFPLEQGELCREGDPHSPARPWKQDKKLRCGCDWIVRWPRNDGVLARCPVHWTLSQGVLPVVLLEVFRGQVRF